MKRTTLVIVIILTFSVVGGSLLGFFFYLNSKQKNLELFGREIVTGNNFGSPSINTSTVVPGNASSTNQNQTPVIQNNTPPTSTILIPVLRKIYSGPVSGFGYFEKDIFATSSAVIDTVVVANGTTTSTTTRTLIPEQRRFLGRAEFIQFADRANGHLYETSSSTLDLTKFSNTTYTKTQEATLPTYGQVLTRSLLDGTDIINTKLGQQKLLTPTSSDKTLVFQDLPKDILEVTLSPNKTRLFAIQKDGVTGLIFNLDGKSPVNIFTSPLKEWLVSWPSEKTLTITTKPSAFAVGYMYKINTDNKRIQKVLGGLQGLTTLMSPDESKVLVSTTNQSSPNLFVYDIKTKEYTNLYLRSFTEKCIWSKKEKDWVYCAVPKQLATGDYPDVWYQGRILFDDTLWKINTNTAETRFLADLSDLSGETIDVTNPQLSKNEDYLLFSNKADLSLWGLRTIVPPLSISTSTPTSTSPTQ